MKKKVRVCFGNIEIHLHLVFHGVFLKIKDAFIISLKNRWRAWSMWKGCGFEFLLPHMHPHTIEMSFHTTISISRHLQITPRKIKLFGFVFKSETLKQYMWYLLCLCFQGDQWTPFPRGTMSMCSHAFAMTMLKRLLC